MGICESIYLSEILRSTKISENIVYSHIDVEVGARLGLLQSTRKRSRSLIMNRYIAEKLKINLRLFLMQ